MKYRFFPIVFMLIIIIAACNTQYKKIVLAIGSLPPKKLLPKPSEGSSGVTSRVDSISNFPITSQERFDFILDLDEELKNKFTFYKDHRSDSAFLEVVNRINKISLD